MAFASPSESLPTVGRACALPFSHNTGNAIRLLIAPVGHVESTLPFSANPVICPRLFIALAARYFRLASGELSCGRIAKETDDRLALCRTRKYLRRSGLGYWFRNNPLPPLDH